ncbi:FKBP-type peptidyl-prolyl cis-trans isomerase [Taibaiella koreensis]|uniref:FKBP-type peptidyl-prolyl cis-trans isomerase n=1 Tax=Taibaiella koreensis TaxID=1268548 RepID=UPI000E5A061A|nr:FKBP-type peptidyl-prolyl cis-trans isomerase [Taibaiella koreensis]
MKYSPLIIAGCALVISTNSCSAKKTDAATKAGTQAVAAQDAKDIRPAIADDKDFVTDPDGLDYKIVTRGTGTVTPKPGDIGEMHVRFRIGDTVMINTMEMNNGQPVPQPFQAPTMKGDLMAGLLKMKAGDSVVFRMLMDTLATRAHQPKPAWVRSGDYAVWEIKMVSIKTKEQVEGETAAREGKQKGIDDKLIQEYLKTKGIRNAKKSPSGFYYVIHTPGTGLSPKAGQTVNVNYTGQNLKGEKFDSNVDPAFHHVEPFNFQLGKNGVIKGWDQGVALMKKGMKATFYLPSNLAYGDHGAGDKIPANTVLIFDIELLSFK